MPLPQFEPPSLAELREWYVKYGHDENIRRLILEVQRSREQMPALSRVLDSALTATRSGGFDRLTSGAAPLNDAASRVAAECRRVAPPVSCKFEFPGFPEAEDDDVDEARIIAQATRRRR
ncbi:MAG TPA: hypothetical protein VF573_00190 [Paraburkholderia sp.]|uniref:hypothetical protein n=1 Tax=Paraburkholderia sp. TaxID=1926495 RepID=UPI002ED077CA